MRTQDSGMMVDGIFIPEEAKLVQKIPLAQIATKDPLFWPLFADGHYNCKSGYRFLKEMEADIDGEAPPDLDKKLWKGIWSLEVPNKHKNLI